jgi:hypothetical protein
MIRDNLNPKFLTAVRVGFHFETVQQLRFACYDVDDPRGAVAAQDFEGEATTTLAEIVVDKSGQYTAPLRNPARPTSRATITVVAEEVHEGGGSDDVVIGMEARELDKKDFFGKSDPYVVISQQREGGATVPVAKTEVIMNTLNPRWVPLVVPVQRLCNGDHDRVLVFECFDWNKRSAHELIGRAQTSLRQLLGQQPQSSSSSGATKTLDLVPAKQKKGGKRTIAGTLVFGKVELRRNPTFLEYLRGGCEINLICAIDFTASNGDPRTATSLHHCNPASPNAYVQAITAVGATLAYYDSDQMIPVYGFGARMPSGEVSHCFALSGNPANPEVAGIAGVIEAYQRALSTVTLYGPTLFAQTVQMAGQIAAMNSQDPRIQKYFVLLIITDGAINGLQDTHTTHHAHRQVAFQLTRPLSPTQT